jgi:hypothetical protein
MLPHLEAPFIFTDMHYAFRKSRSRRAPGPDNLPMEAIRLLPHPLKKQLSH